MTSTPLFSVRHYLTYKQRPTVSHAGEQELWGSTYVSALRLNQQEMFLKTFIFLLLKFISSH